MSVPETLLEIREYTGVGYMPLIDYGAWRVAVLRCIDEFPPEGITRMQRHHETDEVFVLLSGRCILFLGEGDERVSSVHAQDMEPLKLYNVKKRCWHNHTLSNDATVVIVENRDTTSGNSSETSLDEGPRKRLIELTGQLWKSK